MGRATAALHKAIIRTAVVSALRLLAPQARKGSARGLKGAREPVVTSARVRPRAAEGSNG